MYPDGVSATTGAKIVSRRTYTCQYSFINPPTPRMATKCSKTDFSRHSISRAHYQNTKILPPMGGAKSKSPSIMVSERIHFVFLFLACEEVAGWRASAG
jgi:hypothetical protein